MDRLQAHPLEFPTFTPEQPIPNETIMDRKSVISFELTDVPQGFFNFSL
jgi:hypothetical protein